MPGFNGESDQLFKKAARAFRFKLSDEEKSEIWQNIQSKRRVPLFWYWTSAGSAVLLIGAVIYVVSNFQENLHRTELSSAEPITMTDKSSSSSEDDGTLSLSEIMEESNPDPEREHDNPISQAPRTGSQGDGGKIYSLSTDEISSLEYSELDQSSSSDVEDKLSIADGPLVNVLDSERPEETHSEVDGILSDEASAKALSIQPESGGLQKSDLDQGGRLESLLDLAEDIDEETAVQSSQMGAVIGLPLRHLEYLTTQSDGLSMLKEYSSQKIGWQERLSDFMVNREQPLSGMTSFADIKKGSATAADLIDIRALSFLTLSEIELISVLEFDPPEMAKKDRAKNWFVDIYHRQEFTRHRFAHSGFQARYTDKWKAAVNPYFSFSAGITAGRRIFNYFSISTGLEYRRILDKFDYDENRIDYKMLYNEQAYFFLESSGETVWMSDTVLASVRHNSRLTAPNTHQFIRVPLRVEFLYPAGKFQFGLSSGLTLNIVKSHSGYLPKRSTGYREISEGDYRSGLIPEWSLGLIVGYRVTESIDLLVRGEKMIDLENRLESSSGLEKSLNATAVTVAMRKNF